jgi:hypothetical protein
LTTVSTRRAASRHASCSLRLAAALSRDRSFESCAHCSCDEALACGLYAAFGDKHSLVLRALDRYIADALTRMDIELVPRREPVAFVGVVVLAAEPGLSANALPLLLVVGAAFAFAVSNVLTKRYGPFDPLIVGGLLAVSGVAITQVRPSTRPI